MVMGGELIPLIVIVVMVVGFYVGRLYAEIRRARFDMRRTRYGRQNYRRSPPPEKPDHLWW
jgi:hypothetical protein